VDVVDRVGTSYTQHQNKHVQITTTTPSPFNYRKWPTILCNQSTTSRNFYFKICRIYWSGRPTERSRMRLELQYRWDSAVTSFLKTTLRPNLSKTSPVPSSLMLKHTWPFSTWTLCHSSDGDVPKCSERSASDLIEVR